MEDRTSWTVNKDEAVLDIAIFNRAYESTQLQRLAETVGNERLACRLLTQQR